MQLIFSNLFRPKWQHQKVAVRLQAIQQLNPASEEDQAILQQLAKDDASPDVRCQALALIDHLPLLNNLCNQDPNDRVRQDALKRLCLLLTRPQENPEATDSNLSLLQQFTDQDILTHLTINAQSLPLRQQAISQISEEACLEQIILQADNHQLRQIAAERVCDQNRIDELIKRCRQKDKGVYRILRAKADAYRQAQQQSAELNDRACALQDLLEKLANTQDELHYPARLDALRNQWLELPATNREPYQEQTDQLFARCDARAETLLAEEEQRKQHTKLRAEQQAYLDQRQSEDQQLMSLQSYDCAAIIQQHQIQQTRWQSLQDLAPEKSLSQALSKLENRQQQLFHSLTELQQQEDALAALAESPTLASITALESLINWPSAYTKPTALLELDELRQQLTQKQQNKAQRKQKDQQQLKASLLQLERDIDDGNLQQAEQTNRDLQKTGSFGPLEARYRNALARLQELQDWQRFAVLPKIEALCAEMETLSESTLEIPARAEAIKALQAQWKELDSPRTPASLRKRFQTANEQAYAPCKEHYNGERQQRQENLAQRQRLLDELNLFEQQNNWDAPDWKAVAQVSRLAKNEWRKHAPVDRAPGKLLQQQFNQLLTRLDARIAANRDQNGTAKQALIEQAQALVQTNADLNGADSIKALQQQWKQIGATHHKDEQRLWHRFRDLCDQAFQQAKQQRSETQSEAEALCAELENRPDMSQQECAQLEKRFKALLAEHSRLQDLQARFSRAKSQQRRIQEENSPANTALKQCHQLCTELELALLEHASPEHELPPLPEFDTRALESALQPKMSARYQAITELVTSRQAAGVNGFEQSLEQALNQSFQSLRMLCIRAEIETGRSSPEEDQVLRMEYQMARLKDAIEQQKRGAHCNETLKGLYKSWLCTPFNQCHEELKARFDANQDQCRTERS